MAIVAAVLFGACAPEIHREFAGIPIMEGGEPLYPGHQVGCDVVDHCQNVLAEIDAFLAEHDPGQGPAASVTLHMPTSAEGPRAMNRSGGGTWMAIITFGDGSRTALMVGCGVGIEPGRCFSGDALGRKHMGVHPVP
jgi:hypothetical protein